MSGPNTRGMGGVAPKQARTSTAADQRQISIMPSLIPGESTTADGRPAIETETKLSRSPGIFTVRMSSNGKSLWIGEDWIGMGDSEDEGGLEACSESSPGLLFDASGKAVPIGGKRRISVSDLVFSTGGSWTAGSKMLIIALIPPDYMNSSNIEYKGVWVSDDIADNLGAWDSLRIFDDYWNYGEHYVVPIALVRVAVAEYYDPDNDEDDEGDLIVTDIYWNLDSPVVPLQSPSSSSAPVKILGVHPDSPLAGTRMFYGCVYGNGSSENPTDFNATIKIPGLSAAVSDPSYGSWADIPICCGIRTVVTWTGATTVHTRDVVYEAVGLMILV
jgi:hypothetical protein